MFTDRVPERSGPGLFAAVQQPSRLWQCGDLVAILDSQLRRPAFTVNHHANGSDLLDASVAPRIPEGSRSAAWYAVPPFCFGDLHRLGIGWRSGRLLHNLPPSETARVGKCRASQRWSREIVPEERKRATARRRDVAVPRAQTWLRVRRDPVLGKPWPTPPKHRPAKSIFLSNRRLDRDQMPRVNSARSCLDRLSWTWARCRRLFETCA